MSWEEKVQLNLFYSSDQKAELAGLEKKIASFAPEYPHTLNKIDISDNKFLCNALKGRLPRLESSALVIEKDFDPVRIVNFLENSAKSNNKPEEKMSSREKASLFLRRYYPYSVAVLLFLFVLFSFLAPIMMKAGHVDFAQRIYAFYRPVCHQSGFRSFYLFGKQAFYPTALAGMTGFQTYGEASGQSESDFSASSHFIGNEEMGYKIALCERDTAMYLALLLATLIFIVLRNQKLNIPWYIWLIFGLLPIALDGGTQLLGIVNLPFLAWFPARESSPYLRVITGALFGFLTAWYLLYTSDEIMFVKRLELELKAEAERNPGR